MLERLELTKYGMPPSVTINAESGNYQLIGNWDRIRRYSDVYGEILLTAPLTSEASLRVNFDAPEEGLYQVLVYNPTVANAPRTLSFTVQHAFGTDSGSYNPRIFSQWEQLGDFYFRKGGNPSAFVLKGSTEAAAPFNAVRFAKYPMCNGVPGDVCTQ